MIIFGVIAGVSIVKLFLGGIIPGILIGCGLMTVWFFHARKHKYPAGPRASFRQMFRATREAFWALILPLIILGGIISGVYTPTEAAVVAVVYAFVIGLFVYRELRFAHIPEILVQAAKSTSIVLLVCGAATAAGYLLTIAQIPPLLTATILRLSGGTPWLIMFWINVLLLMVGCVMDLTPALLILGPILHIPFALLLGIVSGFLEIVPLVGPLLAAALAGTVAFSTRGTDTTIVVLVVYLVVRQVEDQVVMPLVIGRAVHLHPVVTIFAVLVGLSAWGVLGGLLAVPVAAALNVTLHELFPEETSTERSAPDREGGEPFGGRAEPFGGRAKPTTSPSEPEIAPPSSPASAS